MPVNPLMSTSADTSTDTPSSIRATPSPTPSAEPASAEYSDGTASLSWRQTARYDIPAGIVVFLVALPLCLGIALASGAPLLGGIIAGIVGGIVVTVFSGSELSVSGPAAGLTIIVATAIQHLGSYSSFLAAVVIAGVLQLIFGYVRAGLIGDYVPTSVIRGMLAAIGIIIILTQLPHAFGHDTPFTNEFEFLELDGKPNMLSELVGSIISADPAAVIISACSFVVMLLWEQPSLRRYTFFRLVPSALCVVVLGIGLNEVFRLISPTFCLTAEEHHLVQLPVASSVAEFFAQWQVFNPAGLFKREIYATALTLAVVASLETLLSIEAVDKIDPMKRTSNANKELKAQGIGNIISGLLGGLPLTAVIVRSSANVYAGGKTRLASITHGVLLLVAVLILPSVLNRIPLASLAVVLIMVGYKLTPLSLFQSMYSLGRDQFLPFLATVVVIVISDLLTGIAVGLCVRMFYVIKTNQQDAIVLDSLVNLETGDQRYHLHFAKDVSFLNKHELKEKLRRIPDHSYLLLEGAESHIIDNDINDTLVEFLATTSSRSIEVELRNLLLRVPQSATH
jgi:MFS superfamily sulfate permease-like transporter